MIYQKRQHWCFRDDNNKLHKFTTKAEAEAFCGIKEEIKTVEEVKPVEEFKAPTKLAGLYKNL
jgi:hypothetical protein